MHNEIRNTLAYIVVATLVVITAIWQAQVSVARDLEARHRSLPPPPKTKRAIRAAPQTFTGDVVEDYIVRCEKGMTDREIAWIVEDFKNAGLNSDPLGPDPVFLTRDELAGRQKEFFDHRAAQHHWYLDALVDSLRLNSEQSAKAVKNLSDLFDLEKAHFDESFNAPPNSQTTYGEVEWKTTAAQHPVEELVTSHRWFNDPKLAFMPWNICSLTPAQEELTWKSWVDKSQEEQSAIENQPISASDMKNDPLSRVLPYPAGGIREYGDTVLLAPVYFQWANLILPFLNRQKFIPIEGLLEDQPDSTLLAQIRALHSAQLKLLLLFEPEMTARIQRALNTNSR